MYVFILFVLSEQTEGPMDTVASIYCHEMRFQGRSLRIFNRCEVRTENSVTRVHPFWTFPS